MPKYTIKEISSLLNIPASTLRYYENIGLLNNVERNSTKQRIYTKEHINKLKAIACFKGTGMTISMIQTFFTYESKENEHIDDILSLLSEQKDNIEKQLNQIKNDMKHIERKLKYYSHMKKSIEKNETPPSWDDY